MGENNSEERFREEMLDFKERMIRFTEVAEHKFDGLSSDMRTTTIRLDKIEHRFDNVEQRFDRLEIKVDMVSGKLDSVISKVVKNDERLNSVETRVEILEAEAH